MLTYANCEFVTTRRPCTCADFLEISAKKIVEKKTRGLSPFLLEKQKSFYIEPMHRWHTL